jgi:hypothetical protein
MPWEAEDTVLRAPSVARDIAPLMRGAFEEESKAWFET